MVLFDFEYLCLLDIVRLHVFKSLDLTLVSLFSEVGPSVLDMLVLLLAHFLVSHRKVFVEPLLFCSPQDRVKPE